MTTDSPKNGSHTTANGGHQQVWPRPDHSTSPALSRWSEESLALVVRCVVAALLVVLAFAMLPFVPVRVVDPFKKYVVLDPLIGLLMYWPLSRVLVRVSSLFWGNLLALIPAITLISIRIFANQRDPAFGTQPNLPFGAMIFLGVCSIAAYLLFRTPPR